MTFLVQVNQGLEVHLFVSLQLKIVRQNVKLESLYATQEKIFFNGGLLNVSSAVWQPVERSSSVVWWHGSGYFCIFCQTYCEAGGTTPTWRDQVNPDSAIWQEYLLPYHQIIDHLISSDCETPALLRTSSTLTNHKNSLFFLLGWQNGTTTCILLYNALL